MAVDGARVTQHDRFLTMLVVLAIPLLLASLSGPETTYAACLRRPLPSLRPDAAGLAPGELRLAIADSTNRVLILSVETGEILAACTGGDGRPNSISWRPDGQRLAVLDSLGEIRVFDAADGRLVRRFSNAPILSDKRLNQLGVTYAMNGRVLIAAPGTPAEFFHADDGSRFACVTLAPDVCVSAVAVSRDGAFVALGDVDGRVGVWDARTGEKVHDPIRVPMGTEEFGVHSLDFHPDGRSLAIGTGDCTARIWHLDESAPTRQFSHCDQDVFGGLAISNVRFSPDGTRLLTSSFTWWETRLWDVASGQRLGRHECMFGSPARSSASFTADGRFAVVAVGGIVLNTKNGTRRHTLEPTPGLFASSRYLAGGSIAWAVRDGLLRVCEVESGLVILERATL